MSPKLPIAYIHLLAANVISVFGSCGLMRDIGLPEPSISAVLPTLNVALPPAYHDEALALMKEYADLFSSSLHDFGLLKYTSHHLNLEDNRPF